MDNVFKYFNGFFKGIKIVQWQESDLLLLVDGRIDARIVRSGHRSRGSSVKAIGKCDHFGFSCMKGGHFQCILVQRPLRRAFGIYDLIILDVWLDNSELDGIEILKKSDNESRLICISVSATSFCLKNFNGQNTCASTVNIELVCCFI